MKKIILFLFLAVPATNGYCEFSDSAHTHSRFYTGLLATGAYNFTDNSATYLFNNALRLGIKVDSFVLNFNNSWIYGEQEKSITNNDYNSLFDVDLYRLYPHAYYWGLASYVSSYSLKINNQYQAGAGIAYNVLDHKKLLLNISDGVVYDNMDIYLQDSTRLRYYTTRNSFRLQFHLDTGIITINANGLFQNSFTLANDWIVQANVSLGIKIKKWLTFTTAYTYNRFNRTQRENAIFTYGLTIDRYYQ